MARLKSDPKSLQFQCEHCEHFEYSKVDLQTHVTEVHAQMMKERRVSQGRPKSNSQSRSTVSRKKTEKDLRQCDKCPYYGKNIDMHNMRHHNPDLPYNCDRCGFRALHKRSINLHKGMYQMYHKEKSFQCSLGCGKMFNRIDVLKLHEKRWCANSATKQFWIQKDQENGRAESQKAKQKSRQSRYLKERTLFLNPDDCTTCHECGQVLSTKAIKLHFSRLHPNIPLISED